MPTYEEHLKTLDEMLRLWGKRRNSAVQKNDKKLVKQADHALDRIYINIQITKEFIIIRDSTERIEGLMEKAKHV